MRRRVGPLVWLLLAWGLRLCCLEAVPPGWRDDELINIHVLSGEVLGGHYPIYFTGASGHEPLYHYLQAGVTAVLGFNVLGGHFLPAVCGLLTVALLYALGRRLFGERVGNVAALTLAISFWSLMYSRIGLRHGALPPLTLAVVYLLGSQVTSSHSRPLSAGQGVLLGWLTALAIYTYPAARLLPVLISVFAAALFLSRRVRDLKPVLFALGITVLLVLPLAFAIAQGRSAGAAQGIGADARLAELALPLRELRRGNLHPLLSNIWTTLGMFHATGDPEWLYNIAGRPVFGPVGGVIFWSGVLVALGHVRDPRYFLLLLWLGLGLLPTFLSVPPASLSHSILAQPAVYLCLALPLAVVRHRPVRAVLLVVVVLAVCRRDLPDYFVRWPARGMVRFLYRADYRAAARYLDAHPEVTPVSVSSVLMGPWDRLALQVDSRRADLSVRLFDPRRALLWAAAGEEAGEAHLLLVSHPAPSPAVEDLIDESSISSRTLSARLTLITLRRPECAVRYPPFVNGLLLADARLQADGTLITCWSVVAPLALPPQPLVANPPPPGVYNGPRLAVFTHLLAGDGSLIAGDDGLWVDPLTMVPGDWFIQIHHLAPPPAGPHTVEVGLYDPFTDGRYSLVTGDEYLVLSEE